MVVSMKDIFEQKLEQCERDLDEEEAVVGRLLDALAIAEEFSTAPRHIVERYAR